MRFRKVILREIADHITRLGLQRCPICSSESAMAASPLPVILSIGGFHHEKDDPRWDPEANVRFMVEVRCQTCGHSMLFDSEQFHSGEPTLTTVPPDQEDDLEPAE